MTEVDGPVDLGSTSERPNILLVILDSARAKNTSLHGYERETTPFLSSFADEATMYSQARAPGIHSIASHVSMFTGEEVEEHNAIEHGSRIDTSATIWGELSRDHGYETGLFTANHVVHSASNLAECFDFAYEPQLRAQKRRRTKLFDDAYGPADREDINSPVAHASQSLRSGTPVRSLLNCAWDAAVTFEDRVRASDWSAHGSKFTDKFLSWQETQSGPWAACINLMDTHYPYTPSEEFDIWGSPERHRAQKNSPTTMELLAGDGWDTLAELEPLYDGTLRQADHILEELVAELRETDTLEDTMLIVTSDHGEGFGEYSRINPNVRVRYHSWSVHEVLTHVPLVVSYPGQTSGITIDDVVSLSSLPDAIRSVVEQEDATDPFARENPVLSSTYRLKPDQLSEYEAIPDVEEYTGPWRAVYENTEDGVVKYGQQGHNYLTMNIQSSQRSDIVSTSEHSRVDEIYAELDTSDITDETTNKLDDDLENHLKDLGYIR